jgi:hypothetical protein
MSQSGSGSDSHQQRLAEEKFRVSKMKARLNFRCFRAVGSPKEQLPSDADVAGHIGRLVRNAFKGIQCPAKYARPKTKLIERREGGIGLSKTRMEPKKQEKGPKDWSHPTNYVLYVRLDGAATALPRSSPIPGQTQQSSTLSPKTTSAIPTAWMPIC